MHSPAPPKYVIQTAVFPKVEPTPSRAKKQLNNDNYFKLNSTSNLRRQVKKFVISLDLEPVTVEEKFSHEDIQERLRKAREAAARVIQNDFLEYSKTIKEIPATEEEEQQETQGNQVEQENNQSVQEKQEKSVTFSQQKPEEEEQVKNNNTQTFKQQGVRSPRQKATVESTSSPMNAKSIASPKPNRVFNSRKSPRKDSSTRDSYIATPRKTSETQTSNQ